MHEEAVKTGDDTAKCEWKQSIVIMYCLEVRRDTENFKVKRHWSGHNNLWSCKTIPNDLYVCVCCVCPSQYSVTCTRKHAQRANDMEKKLYFDKLADLSLRFTLLDVWRLSLTIYAARLLSLRVCTTATLYSLPRSSNIYYADALISLF